MSAASFWTPLLIEYLDGRRYRVVEPFQYRVGEDGSEELVVTVPVGFVTNFASVPRVLWAILPPTGEYGKAAVIHDFLYCRRALTRTLCDAIFYEAMRALGVGWLRRSLMYAAVRLFGGPAWRAVCDELI